MRRLGCDMKILITYKTRRGVGIVERSEKNQDNDEDIDGKSDNK